MMRMHGSQQGTARSRGMASRAVVPGRRSVPSIRAYRDQPSPEVQTSTVNPSSNGAIYRNESPSRPVIEHDQRPKLSAIYPRGSVCAVVLGGGESDSRRLFPLTEKRTLPAIPIGSIYRLIDIPLSNLLNSGINKVYVLTQYNSTSLNRYLHVAYPVTGMPTAGGGFVEVVAATQGPKEQRWAEGPADAVRQWWSMFEGNRAQERMVQDVLVLPSDQVYRLNFEELTKFHRDNEADLTIVARPVPEALVDHFGVCKLGKDYVIQEFAEKPTGDTKATMSMDFEEVEQFMQETHLNSVPFLDMDKKSKTWIGSCGMYMFEKDALKALLAKNPRSRDFGTEIIPEAIRSGMKVVAYNYPDYFVDVGGSIQEYFDFNIGLATGETSFNFHETHTKAPFYGSPGSTQPLPPNVFESVEMHNTLIGSGCTLMKCKLVNSIVGSRANIGQGTIIEDTMIMGADYYEHEKTWSKQIGPQFPPIGIGENCVIKKAIVDKNARIGNNVKLLNSEGVFESMDRLKQGIAIRDGVTIVTKSAVLPDGTEV